MRTADLCDITDLVDGLARDMCRKWGFQMPKPRKPAVPAPDLFPVIKLCDETAIEAIDMVLATYPGAVWITADGHGRVVDGDLLISVAIPLTDPDAEHVGWLDGASRLGPMAGTPQSHRCKTCRVELDAKASVGCEG